MAVINGNATNQTLYGGSSADTISGLAGDDVIYAGSGNDLLIGGIGNDELWGMQGHDTYQFSTGDGNDTIYTYANNDIGGADVVQFTNVASTTVTLRRRDLDVELSYSGGVLTFGNQGIRQVQFTDTTWQVSYNAESRQDVATTGIHTIDGLMTGSTYFAGDGQRLTLSFGFPDYTGNGEYDSGVAANLPLRTASAAYQTAVRQQLAHISTLIPVDFVEVTNPVAARLADMAFAGMSGSSVPAGLAGYAFYPGASNIILLDNASTDYSVGGSFYEVLLHELGHKLGLKHTFEVEGAFPALDDALDNSIYTVMSYTSAAGGVNATTYSVLDVQALQHLYGANLSTATGNDTYSFDYSNNAKFLQTIWDAGGTDTISLTGNGVTFSLMSGVINSNANGLGSISIAYNAVIENLTATAGNDVIMGNLADNHLRGQAGNDTLMGAEGNDRLDGGVGADTMQGGAGNDTYVRNSNLDVIVELEGQGIDTVESSLSYTLINHLEHLTLTGAQVVVGRGNSLDNILTANHAGNQLYGVAGNDTLIGGAGADLLDGGVGADTMRGGLGNDTYVRNSSGDVIVELADQGMDTVLSGLSMILGDHLENLTLTGGTTANATGNSLANTVLGNGAANVLDGKAGNDVLNGGLGNDRYVFKRGYAQDVVVDQDLTVGNQDQLSFGSLIDADQLWLSQVGNDLQVSIIGTLDQVRVQGWYSSSANQVEQLVLSSGAVLLNSNVQQLVDAMAGLTPPALGQTELSAAQHAQLDAVIAANWA